MQYLVVAAAGVLLLVLLIRDYNNRRKLRLKRKREKIIAVDSQRPLAAKTSNPFLQPSVHSNYTARSSPNVNSRFNLSNQIGSPVGYSRSSPLQSSINQRSSPVFFKKSSFEPPVNTIQSSSKAWPGNSRFQTDYTSSNPFIASDKPLSESLYEQSANSGDQASFTEPFDMSSTNKSSGITHSDNTRRNERIARHQFGSSNYNEFNTLEAPVSARSTLPLQEIQPPALEHAKGSRSPQKVTTTTTHRVISSRKRSDLSSDNDTHQKKYVKTTTITKSIFLDPYNPEFPPLPSLTPLKRQKRKMGVGIPEDYLSQEELSEPGWQVGARGSVKRSRANQDEDVGHAMLSGFATPTSSKRPMLSHRSGATSGNGRVKLPSTTPMKLTPRKVVGNEEAIDDLDEKAVELLKSAGNALSDSVPVPKKPFEFAIPAPVDKAKVIVKEVAIASASQSPSPKVSLPIDISIESTASIPAPKVLAQLIPSDKVEVTADKLSTQIFGKSISTPVFNAAISELSLPTLPVAKPVIASLNHPDPVSTSIAPTTASPFAFNIPQVVKPVEVGPVPLASTKFSFGGASLAAPSVAIAFKEPVNSLHTSTGILNGTVEVPAPALLFGNSVAPAVPVEPLKSIPVTASAFSFGAPAIVTGPLAVQPAVSAFSFGNSSAPSTTTLLNGISAPISLASPAASISTSNIISSPAFSFGSAAPAPPTPMIPPNAVGVPAPIFSFGTNQSLPQSTTLAPIVQQPAASTSFSFGAQAASAPTPIANSTPAFSFGNTTSTSSINTQPAAASPFAFGIKESFCNTHAGNIASRADTFAPKPMDPVTAFGAPSTSAMSFSTPANQNNVFGSAPHGQSAKGAFESSAPPSVGFGSVTSQPVNVNSQIPHQSSTNAFGAPQSGAFAFNGSLQQQAAPPGFNFGQQPSDAVTSAPSSFTFGQTQKAFGTLGGGQPVNPGSNSFQFGSGMATPQQQMQQPAQVFQFGQAGGFGSNAGAAPPAVTGSFNFTQPAGQAQFSGLFNSGAVGGGKGEIAGRKIAPKGKSVRGRKLGNR